MLPFGRGGKQLAGAQQKARCICRVMCKRTTVKPYYLFERQGVWERPGNREWWVLEEDGIYIYNAENSATEAPAYESNDEQ